MSKKLKRTRIFYGWFVVAAGFAVTMSLGETFWSFGVFFKPLETEFEWSRALVSSGYMAFILGYSLAAIFAGRLADRYNPRSILLVAALLAGLGISLCSQVQTIDQLRIFLFIAGVGAGPTWPVPTSNVQRWFSGKPHAGLALSIVSTGVAAGAIIFAPLINYLILSYGWRNAFLVVGVLFFVIIVLASFVMKQSPTEIKVILAGGKSTQISAGIKGRSISKIVTTPAFMGIVLTNCIAVIAFQVVTVHLVPHAMDVAITATAAAAALGIMGAFSIPGRVMSGLVADRIGWQKTMALSLFVLGVSMIVLLLLKAEWILYCFVFLYGISHGARVTCWVGILGEFFGMRAVGETLGISQAAGQFMGAFAPYIAGVAFDTTGSYSIVFIIMTVLLFGAGLVAVILRKPLDTLEQSSRL